MMECAAEEHFFQSHNNHRIFIIANFTLSWLLNLQSFETSFKGTL